MIKKIIRLVQDRTMMFVTVDPKDNSVTFSTRLYKHIISRGISSAKVFPFKIPELGNRYAFAIDVPLEQEASTADIQYNAKYGHYGYESLAPTVNRIVYDYKLDHDKPHKLSVSAVKIQALGGKIAYIINTK